MYPHHTISIAHLYEETKMHHSVLWVLLRNFDLVHIYVYCLPVMRELLVVTAAKHSTNWRELGLLSYTLLHFQFYRCVKAGVENPEYMNAMWT
jgi:hypothetical protein